MERQIITTADGSSTLFVPELNEHYHSTFGAIQESKHIFIEHGVKSIWKDLPHVTILEIGFGTGLNALLMWVEALSHQKSVRYWSVETDPLSAEEIHQLNYPQQLGQYSSLFSELHLAPWNEEMQLDSFFQIKKIEAAIERLILPNHFFDAIYFDAFGPDVQPELWTEYIFTKLNSTLKKGGILVTYSAKGSVRRALKSAGFNVEKLPGPPGKREITMAIK